MKNSHLQFLSLFEIQVYRYKVALENEIGIPKIFYNVSLFIYFYRAV